MILKPWRSRAKRMPLDRGLSAQQRMCLPTKSDFPSYPDESAEFYRHAIDLAWRMRSPLLAVYHVSIACLVATALAVLFWLAGQAVDRALPVHGVVARMLSPTVAADDKVKVHYDMVRDKVCAVDITASILDGAGVTWPLVTLHRDVTGPTGPDHFTRSWQVPAEAAPGPARLRVGWAYACPGNYLQGFSPVLLAFPDLPFTIKPPP